MWPRRRRWWRGLARLYVLDLAEAGEHLIEQSLKPVDLFFHDVEARELLAQGGENRIIAHSFASVRNCWNIARNSSAGPRLPSLMIGTAV